MKLEQGCSAQTNTFRDSSSANLWIVNPFGKFRKRFINSLMTPTRPPRTGSGGWRSWKGRLTGRIL